MGHKKVRAGGVILSFASVMLALIFLAPVVWSLFVSFQREGKQITTILDWFTPPYTFMNYPELIIGSDVTKWLRNSVFVAVVVTALTVFLSAMAAFSLAKIPFKGRNGLFFYFLLGLMVPGEATIVPLFITANGLNLIDSYMGLILPSIAVFPSTLLTFYRRERIEYQ